MVGQWLELPVIPIPQPTFAAPNPGCKMFYILHKLNLFFHQIIIWLYNDVDKAFSAGGFVGAGITASVFHLKYWYWAKVIVSA